MTYGDINSGATPQPGGVAMVEVQEGEEPQTAQEQVAQATQDALNLEGPWENVKASLEGKKGDDEGDEDDETNQPVVEKDDQEASGASDESEEEQVGSQGYIPVVEADDQAASAGEPLPSVEDSEEDSEEESSEGSEEESSEGSEEESSESSEEQAPEDSGTGTTPPSRSASKAVWVAYAISQGADGEEVQSKSRDELADQYGS